MLSFSLHFYKTLNQVISWKAYEEDGDKITELVVECPLNFHYFPGQYCELQFKPISSYEWRPFTIIWCPPHETVVLDERSQLKFCIKAVGDWTGKLYNLASAFDLSKAAIPTEISIRGEPFVGFFDQLSILLSINYRSVFYLNLIIITKSSFSEPSNS